MKGDAPATGPGGLGISCSPDTPKVSTVLVVWGRAHLVHGDASVSQTTRSAGNRVRRVSQTRPGGLCWCWIPTLDLARCLGPKPVHTNCGRCARGGSQRVALQNSRDSQKERALYFSNSQISYRAPD